MKIKHWLSAGCLSLLFLISSSQAITLLSHPDGTGGKVIFNTFEDSFNLANSRGWGIEWSKFKGCLSIPSTGYFPTYIKDGNAQKGFPFFGNVKCMQDAYYGVHKAISARDSLAESNFAMGRKCVGSDCVSGSTLVKDTKLKTVSGNQSGTLPYWMKTEGACNLGKRGVSQKWISAAKYSKTKKECELTFRKKNYSAIPKYHDSLRGLKKGDRIRVYVYLHNNATQYEDKTSLNYTRRLAKNTTVKFDWSQANYINTTIDSDQTSPISDKVSYAFYKSGAQGQIDPAMLMALIIKNGGNTQGNSNAGPASSQKKSGGATQNTKGTGGTATTNNGGGSSAKLKLTPVVDSNGYVSLYRDHSGSTSKVKYTSGTNFTVPMGNVASSYGNVQNLYVDFEVSSDASHGADDYTVTKSAGAIVSGSAVQFKDGENITDNHKIGAGNSFTYTIAVKNNDTSNATDTVILTDVLDSDLTWSGTSDTGVTHAAGKVTLNFGKISAGKTVAKSFTVKINGSLAINSCVKIDNTVRDNDGHSDDISLCVRNPRNGVGTYSLKKVAINPATSGVMASGENITDKYDIGPGDEFIYEIRLTNTSYKGKVVLTDVLDSNLDFVRAGTSSAVWYDSMTRVVTLDFGSPATSTSSSSSFVVRVNSGITGTSCTNIPNTVLSPVISISGSTVTHCVTEEDEDDDDGGGGGPRRGGGGGGDLVRSAGICHQSPTGAYSCRRAYPAWDLSDPHYLEYKACKKSAEKLDEECVAEWANKKEFAKCTLPTKFTENLNLRGKDPKVIAQIECAERVEIPGCDLSNFVSNGGVTIEKTVKQSHVAAGDDIKYNVTLGINTGNTSELSISTNGGLSPAFEGGIIKSATVKVYDYVVPSQSGWLCNRQVEGGTWDWKDSEYKNINGIEVQQGNHFTATFRKGGNGSGIIDDLNKGGVAFDLSYLMDTGLLGCNANEKCRDIDTVKNVAFAVIDFTLEKEVAGAEKNSKIVRKYTKQMRSALPSNMNECALIYAEDLHSLGDTVTANINIVRPFVQTRGGSNLAINSTEKIVGNQSDGSSAENFAGVLNSNLSQSNTLKATYLDKLKNNASINRWVDQFTTTPDLAGVNIKQAGGYTVPQEFTNRLGRSETFIIVDGDLIINHDIVMTGTSREYFPAFIVQKGDILIHPDVAKIEGIYIALEGELQSSVNPWKVEKTVPVSVGVNAAKISEKQLLVSGSLVGDAADLLRNRKYIGRFENGMLVNGLEPSVKITYDLRLIENTPPGLENFLGRNWQQKID